MTFVCQPVDFIFSFGQTCGKDSDMIVNVGLATAVSLRKFLYGSLWKTKLLHEHKPNTSFYQSVSQDLDEFGADCTCTTILIRIYLKWSKFLETSIFIWTEENLVANELPYHFASLSASVAWNEMK